MLVLGLSGNFSPEDENLAPGMDEFLFHDAAACLVRDGVVVAAAEEERFNRVKKTTKFPTNAIRYCLDAAGAAPSELDAVAYYFDEFTINRVLNEVYLRNARVPARFSRELMATRLREDLGLAGIPGGGPVYVPHHQAHATATLVHSGFDESLVLVMDGTGGSMSGTVYRSRGTELEQLAVYSVPKSLGIFYLAVTLFLGYTIGDEYKVMGLAPYGDPERYRELFESFYSLEEKGGYELDWNTARFALLANGFTPRRRGEPFTRSHKDMAAAIQAAVERIALHVLGYWREATGLSRLCFSGGVAHNCSLNGEILRSGLFDEVFVHPASHDAGAAVGAALVADRTLRGDTAVGERLVNANWGPGPGDVEQELTRWKSFVDARRSADVVAEAADLLADGKVIGWVQGGSEFGPRALGNRSILADPRPAENQTRINAMIKLRESFRPFAPAVLAEAAADYFELPATDADYEFMSFVLKVRPGSGLGAVTHVDDTARVQCVSTAANPLFHRLIGAFGERTGTPVLLNTSFNNNAEPIVQTVEQAVVTFLTTELDVLVVGDHVVTRAGSRVDVGTLVPTLLPSSRLTETTRRTLAGELVGTRGLFFEQAPANLRQLSDTAFTALTNADGIRTLRELAGEWSDEVAAEFTELWRDRLIGLAP